MSCRVASQVCYHFCLDRLNFSFRHSKSPPSRIMCIENNCEGTDSMGDQQSKYYFLGANSADGFYSLYDNLVSLDKGDFLWIIKGGSGCGKSSFMRIIASAAERQNFEVEYIACSGDPESLDGIYIPKLKTAYMDGTAPHVTDVNLAAVNSSYIDLGRFYDHAGIAEHRDELLRIKNENSLQYQKAYSLFAAAGDLSRGWLPSMSKPAELHAASKRVAGIIRRELGTRHRNGGEITRRFLSAYTCLGLHAFPATADALCKKCFLFESRLGLAAPMLQKIADSACGSGFKVLLCPDPLTPEIPEAVFIPEASLGFISASSALAVVPNSRSIHLDAKGADAAKKVNRSELSRYEKTSGALKAEALKALAQAKFIHDKLERVYNPYVDFTGVHALAGEHLKMLGLE